MKNVSILIPCYNEEAVIEIFYRELCHVVDPIQNYIFQFIFINDGSTDHTLHIIKALRLHDQRISYLDLSRNFGKELAMIAGLDYAESDAVIFIDADLQDPPQLIPTMLRHWEEGYNDVCAKRTRRKGEKFIKTFSSHLYYRILQKFTKIPIQIDVGDFRLLDKQCIETLKLLRESQRYTKGLLSWIGFNKKEILFERGPRSGGTTKWNSFELINLAIEGITSFSIVPLRIASFAGIIISLFSFLYMFWIIIGTLFWSNPVAGYPSLISIILFMGGIQLTVIGLMGEYLGRIFNESKNRPLYLVNEYNGQKIMMQKMNIPQRN